MKSFVAILSTMLTLLISSTAFALSYETPTCILMKFSNDTRFQSIDSASVLSDLVIEKMLKSEKFNLRETKPIDHDMETQLYREKIRDIENAKSGMISGNFNALFEGPGFDPDLAESNPCMLTVHGIVIDHQHIELAQVNIFLCVSRPAAGF